MTSSLPPRRRDSRTLEDLIRQDRTRLAQLDRGLVFGRFPSARPLKPRMGDTDVEEDDPADQTLFRNVDTVTVTGPGRVTFPLTYEPVDGSLQVWWGGVPQPPTEWTLSGSTVTIPDPDSRIAAGDKFTAYYAYEDVEPDPAPVLESITFRGMQKTGGATTPAALPAATQVGDTLVLVLVNTNGTDEATCTDARMTQVASAPWPSRPDLSQFARVYMGQATTLDPLSLSLLVGGPEVTAFVLAFAEAMTVTAHAATDSEIVTPKSIPSVVSPAALCVAAQANNVVVGSSPTISGAGWTTVSDSGPSGNLTEFAVAKFLDNALTSTPAGTVAAGVGDAAKGFWVLTIGVALA